MSRHPPPSRITYGVRARVSLLVLLARPGYGSERGVHRLAVSQALNRSLTPARDRRHAAVQPLSPRAHAPPRSSHHGATAAYSLPAHQSRWSLRPSTFETLSNRPVVRMPHIIRTHTKRRGTHAHAAAITHTWSRAIGPAQKIVSTQQRSSAKTPHMQTARKCPHACGDRISASGGSQA